MVCKKKKLLDEMLPVGVEGLLACVFHYGIFEGANDNLMAGIMFKMSLAKE